MGAGGAPIRFRRPTCAGFRPRGSLQSNAVLPTTVERTAMPTGIRRIAVNTGGGDAPGLNAVVRAVVLAAVGRGWEVLGIRKGYEGLIDTKQIIPLTRDSVRGITHLGGTILGTVNKGDP